MALLDVTIVNIAIPAIIDDLDASVTKVSWVINAYSLALAVLFLSHGPRLRQVRPEARLRLRRPRRCSRVFSLLCGLAPNIEWLIVFRVGQGVGGAALAPISLAILFAAFPRRQHGMAVGIWGAHGHGGRRRRPHPRRRPRRVPLVALDLLRQRAGRHRRARHGAVVIPERRPNREAQGIDLPGILLSAVRPLLPRAGAHPGQRLGLDLGGASSASFAVAVVSYPLFMWWELRTPSPMFDFRLLRIRSFTAANTRDVLHRRGPGRLHVPARPLPRQRARLQRAAGRPWR